MSSIFYNKLLMQKADYILVHKKKKIYILIGFQI